MKQTSDGELHPRRLQARAIRVTGRVQSNMITADPRISRPLRAALAGKTTTEVFVKQPRSPATSPGGRATDARRGLGLVGGRIEAVVLPVLAAVRGYRGHTFGREPDHAPADAPEPTPGPGAVRAPDRPAILVRRLWGTLGIGVFALAAAMGLTLHQFSRATTCAVARPSDPCVHSLQGTISRPGWTENVSGYNGNDTTRYHHVVVLGDTGRRVEFWTFRPRPDLRVGDTVTLEQWKGHVITVGGHGRRTGADGWKPEPLGWMLAVLYASTAVAAGLWRVGLLSLDEHPRGRLGRLRSVLGWLVLTITTILAIITISWGLSAPGLYLYWW